MADPDRRPTAQEIEELIDLVRRDPASPAFIDLGEAYLALGRPKDAISVGNLGIEAAPDNLEGRVMLARAHCVLHHWKEAQGELLRVVKVDRSNRQGFALLGEVLLRRNDFERAVPVLQHAQNLDPTSPQILSMLKRARAGQALDPPPPVPTPVPPRGETHYGLALEPEPPRAPARPAMPPAPLGGPVPSASPAAPTMAIQPAPAAAPPPGGDPSWGAPAAAPPARGPKQTAPPPMSVEGVRPRVLSSAKPQNAAAASLRQSAAVGETYLNDLLTGGLLDVAGVRVPDMDFDLRPDRRWGRSTRRAFIFLFIVLVVGIGGGTSWYWWSQKQQAEAVARLLHDAKQSIGNGDFAGFETSLGKLREALDKDKKNVLTYAYAAETGGLEALLYGTDADRVDEAIKGVGHDIKPGEPGAREVVIGKAAVELSRLGSRDNPNTMLVTVAEQLDAYLAKHPDDRWAQWLRARELLMVGSRTAAKAALKTAAGGDDGLAVAMIDEAELLADEGSTDQALALYDQALAKSKDHPLAILGKSIVRAESTVGVNDAIDDLNVKLDPKIKNFGTRVTSYRNLALALLEYSTEDYAHGADDLKKAVAAAHPPLEARFWALVAWARFQRGEIAQAKAARDRVTQYTRTRGPRAEDDPAIKVIDAALQLADGHAEQALDTSSKLQGVRAAIVRASAELDLGKAKDALADLDAVLKLVPQNLEVQILDTEARMVASTSAKDRSAAADALEHLARKAKSKIGRHALGTAYLMVGDPKNAQPQLDQALADLGDDAPNPLAYRTHTELAQILIGANDLANAEKHVEAALALQPDYVPAHAVKARLLLAKGDPDGALEALRPLAKGPMTPAVELTMAEALCTHKGASDQDKQDAARLLGEIKDKVQPPTEVARVAAACDPALPEKLGLEAPPDPDAPKPKPHHHHHHRR